MYAEDDLDDQQALTDIFASLRPDISVICCPQGLALMQWLDELPVGETFPGCIVLDMNMPIWDGLQTLEQLKKHPALKEIPVVMFTTSSAPRDMDRCLELGAEAFLTKPSKDAEMEAVARKFALLCERPLMHKRSFINAGKMD